MIDLTKIQDPDDVSPSGALAFHFLRSMSFQDQCSFRKGFELTVNCGGAAGIAGDCLATLDKLDQGEFPGNDALIRLAFHILYIGRDLDREL